MANQSFTSILDRPSNAAEPPPVIPQGSYIATISGQPRFDKSSRKQTDFVEFTLNLMAAQKDVDQEELDAMGGIAGKQVRDTYYLTDAAEYRLRKFLDDCDIPDQDKKGEPLSHRERIDLSPGCQVGIYIKHTTSEDGTRIFANTAGTFRAE